MIFLDESGKRWKRIKHSTIGVTALGSLSVAVLLAGSVAYNPQWGVLPLVQHTTGAVLAAATGAVQDKSKAPTPKNTTSTAKKTPAAARPVAYQSAVTNAVLTSALVATPAPKAAPSPTPTPTPKGDPIQNDFGQYHKKTTR